VRGAIVNCTSDQFLDALKAALEAGDNTITRNLIKHVAPVAGNVASSCGQDADPAIAMALLRHGRKSLVAFKAILAPRGGVIKEIYPSTWPGSGDKVKIDLHNRCKVFPLVCYSQHYCQNCCLDVFWLYQHSSCLRHEVGRHHVAPETSCK
jgi:hypothetical protein